MHIYYNWQLFICFLIWSCQQCTLENLIISSFNMGLIIVTPSCIILWPVCWRFLHLSSSERARRWITFLSFVCLVLSLSCQRFFTYSFIMNVWDVLKVDRKWVSENIGYWAQRFRKIHIKWRSRDSKFYILH